MTCSKSRGVPLRRIRFHEIPTNECWTRDHGPAFVLRTRRGRTEAAMVDWGFNAWGGKYPPFDADDAVPTRVAEELELPVFYPGIVMEGGAVDFNGEGTVLTTTSCLLNKNRNPTLSRAQVEQYLQATTTARSTSSGSVTASRATTPTGTSTTSPASSTRARSSSASKTTSAIPTTRCCRRTAAKLARARDAQGRPFDDRGAADAAAGELRRAAPAGHLHELLFRQRRRCSCRRSARPRATAGRCRSCSD